MTGPLIPEHLRAIYARLSVYDKPDRCFCVDSRISAPSEHWVTCPKYRPRPASESA